MKKASFRNCAGIIRASTLRRNIYLVQHKPFNQPTSFYLWWASLMGYLLLWVILNLLHANQNLPSQRIQTSLRHLQDVLKRSRRLTTKPNVVKTSGKRCLIYDVLKTPYLHRLEDVQFATSWRHLIYSVLRTSDLRRLEDVRFTSSWRRL